MEIHELNTFSGTPGSGDYFATDNGEDTSKITAEALFAPLNARIDNIIAGPASSAQEVIDARQGADGVTYASLRDAIQTQVETLQDEIYDAEDNTAFKSSRILKIKNIDNGKYWGNTDGIKHNADAYSCSHNLIAVDPDFVFGATLVSENENNMYITCFNASKQLIAYHQIFGTTERANSTATPNFAIPAGTYYIGISLKNTPDASELIVRMLENVSVVEYPYDNSNLIYLTNKWRNGNGSYGNINTFDCVVIPSVKAGDKYYVNAT